MTIPPMTSVPATGPLAEAPGWRDARLLLRGPLRTLVAGQASGSAADGLAQIAFAQVVLFEIGEGATPGEIAAILAATLLPFSIVGPFAGVVIDRWDRRRVLTTVSLMRVAIALGAVAVVALDSEPLAYLGIVVLLASSRFVLAGKGAALPRTVATESLVPANAISALLGMVAVFTGAVLGSTFVASVAEAGFVVAALGYAVAAWCFSRLPNVGGGGASPPMLEGVAGVAREMLEGFGAIAGSRLLRDPLLAVWAHRTLLGAGFVVLVLVADERYGLEAPGYGLAIAVTGVGAFLGTVAAPPLGRVVRPVALAVAAFVVAGAAAICGASWTSLAPLVVALGVVAFAFQVLKVHVDAIVGREASDAVRGRVFAVYDVLYNVAFVVAGLALVPLWRSGREEELLFAVGLGFWLAAVVFARALRTWPFMRSPSS